MYPSETKLKRQIYRGQSHHFQRGYELSRLRFENDHKDAFERPKPYFVREFHEGRDVPQELFHLTQPARLVLSAATVSPALNQSNLPSPPTLQPTVSPLQPTGHGHDDNDDQFSLTHDEKKQYFATKAALKAALNPGDKDISILDVVKAIKANRSKQPQSDDHDEHSNSDSGSSKPSTGDMNKSVLFDEQIKEDLDKIREYDPK